MDDRLELLFAVAAEIEGAALRERLDGDPDLARVELATLGVGASCIEHLRVLLQQRRPKTLVSPGLAGALDPALRPGDVLLIRGWVDPDRPHDRSCDTPPRLLERARSALRDAGIASHAGDAVTVDAPLHDAARRHGLHRDTGAAVVEMEGRYWAELATAAGVEFLSVRVISDDAATPLPLPRHLLLERSGRIRWDRWLQALAQDGRSERATEELRLLFRARREWVAAMHSLDAVSAALLHDFCT